MVFSLYTANNQPIPDMTFPSYAEAQAHAYRLVSGGDYRALNIRAQSDASRTLARKRRDIARKNARRMKHA